MERMKICEFVEGKWVFSPLETGLDECVSVNAPRVTSKYLSRCYILIHIILFQIITENHINALGEPF